MNVKNMKMKRTSENETVKRKENKVLSDKFYQKKNKYGVIFNGSIRKKKNIASKWIKKRKNLTAD